MHAIRTISIVVMFATSAPARGEVLEFTDDSEWQSAVGDFTTIDFTEHPPGRALARR
jgi:hypothetical protein